MANQITRNEKGARLQTYRRFKEGEDFEKIEAGELSAMIGLIQKRRCGRPAVFETVDELEGATDAYWEYIEEANQNGCAIIPDIEGYCSYLGISRKLLSQWETTDFHGFTDTINKTKNDIAAMKKQLALKGKIPPVVFATDFNNNHGYTQASKYELEVKPVLEAPEKATLIAEADLLPDDLGE